jgi:Bacterial SH3 domain
MGKTTSRTIAAVICLAAASIASIASAANVTAVVTGRQVRIRKEARVESVALDAVPLGGTVTIIDEKFDGTLRPGWIKVKALNGVSGYMSTGYMSIGADKKGLPVEAKTDDAAPKIIFSLAPPAEPDVKTPNPAPAPATKTVEILDKYDAESRIKGDIDNLTESLAKEGKEADIRSVVVIYKPKAADADKTALREEVKQLKAVIAEKEKTYSAQAQENTWLKQQNKELEGAQQAGKKLEGELVALRGELARRTKESPVVNTNDVAEMKAMVATIQRDLADMRRPLVADEKVTAQAAAKAKAESEEITNLRNVVAALTRMPDFKLVSEVESSGEEVFLKGVGNVKMTTKEDLVIFRVPKESAQKGQKVFAHLLKRIIDGDLADYFICDKKMVQGAKA